MLEVIKTLLKNLNPSLFQNVILGVLTISIPLAIVFLTDILEKKNDFEQMVLNDEVLKFKIMFWISIAELIFFSFFSGKNIWVGFKIAAILAITPLSIFFGVILGKILKFSGGEKLKFEKSFLKKLNPSKISNKKDEKIIRAWECFYKEQPEQILRVKEFTDIFISHIDNAIKRKKFELAVEIAKKYVTNIEKQDSFLVSNNILPKVLEWDKILYDINLKTKNKKSYKRCNYAYFRGEFFPKIIERLFEDKENTSNFNNFFFYFKKHIDSIKIDDIKKQIEYKYIEKLLKIFCKIFFNRINDYPSEGAATIWEGDFPEEWKVKIENSKNKVSPILAKEFLLWSQDYIFCEDYRKPNKVAETINGLFPETNLPLFLTFLTLVLLRDIKIALKEKPNPIIDYNFKEGTEKKTIQIILNYFFPLWDKVIILKNDLPEKDYKNWNNLPEERKKIIYKQTQIKKLEKIKNEFEDEEIKKICDKDKTMEQNRKNFLELIDLLIKELKEEIKFLKN